MTQQDALQILKSGVNVFLTGEPGSGKTYTINQFVEWCHEEDKGVAITASTGIAATHINGQTIHSWSGLGTKRAITEDQVENMKFDDKIRDRISYADVLVVDEVSMLDAVFIDNLDFVLRIMRDARDKPFGGIQIIFVGDFFQLPPVPERGKVAEFAFESVAWNLASLRYCYLTEQHRQSDGLFLTILTGMRTGTITEEHKQVLRDRTKVEEPQMHLYPTRMEVDSINDHKLAQLKGESHFFKMHSDGHPFVVQILKRSVLSPELLEVKVGAEVMFTRNEREGLYVNGTLGTVIGFDEENGHPIVETRDGRHIVPARAEWTIEERGTVKASVRQVPLRLAWAITVHKSQGMSLDSASIDLSKCFEYGQGYVAISRVRTLEGLHLQGLNGRAFAMHPKVIAQDAIFREQGA